MRSKHRYAGIANPKERTQEKPFCERTYEGVMRIKKTPSMILKVLMKEQRITQQQFATIVGVSQGMVGHWINDRKLIGAESAIKIQDHYGVKAWELCPILEAMKPTHKIIDANTGKIICLAQINEAIDISEVKINIKPIYP